MSKGREIRVYDYVNHPYAMVRDVLRLNSPAVFQMATKAAAARAKTVASELSVEVAGIEIGADVTIAVRGIEEKEAEGLAGPSTCIHLEWEATTLPGLFPFMKADLLIYPLTATETQLDFAGVYEPPLGALGKVLDAVAGHRIAEVSVHRFITDVAVHLRESLARAGR